MIIFDEIEKLDDCILMILHFLPCAYGGLKLDCSKVSMDAYFPPCTAKDEPSAFNKDFCSDYRSLPKC